MDLLNIIYIGAVIFVGLLAFLVLPSTLYIRGVHQGDTAIPKNELIKALYVNAFVINASALIMTVLVAFFLFRLFSGDMPDPFSLQGMALLTMITAVLTSPVRTARALKKIGSRADMGGETQNQREDRQFGEERRSLEAEHVRTKARLDKKLK